MDSKKLGNMKTPPNKAKLKQIDFQSSSRELQVRNLIYSEKKEKIKKNKIFKIKK